ncbi:MAG: acyl-CoA desaturase [Cyanothece sp. SIO1E1]|nr:acyl-CoA desaturase [Cyanothece sp. SIO1E1]
MAKQFIGLRVKSSVSLEEYISKNIPNHNIPTDMQLSRVIGVILIHFLCIFSIFYVTRNSILISIIMFILSGGFGINIGYHRFLSHRSFKTSRVMQFILGLLGVLAMQCGPITWVGLHRLHHRETDQELDPHSPRVSLLWAHFLWTFFPHPMASTYEDRSRYAKDLVCFPELVFLEKNFLIINIGFLAILLASGYLLDGWHEAISYFTCAGCLRILLIWHLTFIVNSVNHKWGYRNYDTSDDSKNNLMISLLVFFGEGWHNNHHAEPRSAMHGHRWFEFDLAYYLILILQKLNLVRSVRLPKRARI